MNDLLYKDLTFKIRSGLFNVYNTLGYGHKEGVYQKALAKEFEALHIPFTKEPSLEVVYKNSPVGYYRPDFVVEGKIIVELKALEILPKQLEKQIVYYLKSTGYKLGLLVNFGSPNLYIKRLIWTTSEPGESVKIRQQSV